MKPGWLWDTNITIKEIQAVLTDPQHERFTHFAALLLSRNNDPKEVFDEFLDKKAFVQNWSRIKRQMRKDSWNDPRIIFWQAVYEKLVSDFKEKGIALRSSAREFKANKLVELVAEKIKAARHESELTQGELAERIGIAQQIISRIEKGRSDVRVLTLEKIARALGKEIKLEITAKGA